MEENEMQIRDNNEDKKYFTIIPNYILHNSTADEQALYVQMKRIAGEKGECFITQRTLARYLGWERRKVAATIKKLLARKWIIQEGVRVIKTHPVNIYKIADLWELNTNFYTKKKGSENSLFLDPDERREPKENLTREPRENLTREPKRNLEEYPIKEEPIKEEDNIASQTVMPWSLKEELLKMEQDPKRHIQIIKLWIEQKGLKPENKEQLNSIIKRNLRSASLLKGYTNEDIIDTIQTLKNTEYLKKFTLETVSKYIDEVISQRKKKGPRIIRWEEVRKPNGEIAMRPIFEKSS